MSDQQISADVREFFLKYIHTIEQLQVLLLVHSNTAKKWSAHDISDELRIDPISASHRLMELHYRGILAHKDGASILDHYQYKPNDEVGKIIDETARLYAEEKSKVINLIQARYPEELAQLADAFKFKKDK